MKFILQIVVLSESIFIMGCQYDPYASDLTINKPGFNEVAGRYVFEQQTVDNNFTKQQFAPAEITLYKDSTFDVSDVPDFAGMNFRYRGLVYAKGIWKIEAIGAVANGFGKDDEEWGITMTSMSESLQSIGLMGDKPPYKLIVAYGDPDEGAVMIFHKK